MAFPVGFFVGGAMVIAVVVFGGMANATFVCASAFGLKQDQVAWHGNKCWKLNPDTPLEPGDAQP